MKDYYLILGVEHNASQAEIDKAYKDLMRFIHPNFWQNSPEMKEKAEERSKLLNEAYSVLKNPSKRAQYDGEFQNAFTSKKPFSNWEETKNEYAASKRAEAESSRTEEQRKQTKHEGEGRATKDESQQRHQQAAEKHYRSEQKNLRQEKSKMVLLHFPVFLLGLDCWCLYPA
jgi:curved DNA-binding protein CbpA